MTGLVDRSRRPPRSAHQISAAMERVVCDPRRHIELPEPALPRQRPEVVGDPSCTTPNQGDQLALRLGTPTDPFDPPGDGDGAEGDAASVENGGGTRGLAFEELLHCRRPSVLAHLIEPRCEPIRPVQRLCSQFVAVQIAAPHVQESRAYLIPTPTLDHARRSRRIAACGGCRRPSPSEVPIPQLALRGSAGGCARRGAGGWLRLLRSIGSTWAQPITTATKTCRASPA